jgi:outer membrane lipase/esterase
MRFIGLLFALFGFIVPALADPADYNRIIAFGDSLSDNGNLFKNTGFPPGPYFDGRFSNGPTWIELLSNPAKSGNPGSSMDTFWNPPLFTGFPNTGGTTQNVNAAVGGAQTVSGFLPSVQTQINVFTAAGGTFGPRDLVSIQGGANDIFNFFTSTPNPTQAQIAGFGVTTAANEASNIGLAIADGAKTILVSNLPNIGATPNFNGSPLTAAAGNLASVSYNTALNAATIQLAALNPKVNLVQMDWYAFSNVITANAAALGFTNITQPCFNSVTMTVCANPNSFTFWDGVHPTEAVHELLARYAALLLSTEETGKAVSALAQMGLSNRLDASDIIFRRFGAVADRGPGGLYAEIIGSTASFNGTNTATYGNTGFDYSLGGVRAGFDASSGPITFGSAIAFQTGSLSGKRLSSDVSTTQFDAYALTRFGAFFTGIEGGVSLDDYGKLRRATGFPTVTADGGTQSVDYSFAGTVGAQYQFGSVTLTPAARLGYAALNIDSFTESAPILALQYSSQDVSTGFWTARLRASTNFFAMPNATVYGEAGYEGLFATSQTYTAKLAFNTAHAVTLSDDLDARGFFIKTGIGGYIFDGVQLSGEYELSTQNGNGDIQSGRLRITIPLHGGLSLKD